MKGETCTQYLTLSSVLKPISSFSSGTDAAGYSSSDISACTKLAINAPKDGRGINQKQDDMFLIAGKCGTLIRRDRGAGSRLLANARKS